MSYFSRIVNVFRSSRINREIDEELEAHIQDAIDEGRDPEEARRAFGSILRAREQSRDVRIAPRLDSLRADLIFGLRQLKKNKAASSAAVLTLALAVGACVSAFRIIDALLLRPLPVSNPERLYIVTYPSTTGDGKVETGDHFDYPQFRLLRDGVKGDAELIAITAPSRNGLTFGSDQETERFRRQLVSGWMFDSFGLKPALGRLLNASDDVKAGAHPVAVLSHDYWTRRFGRDPRVIGRTFRMGTDVYEIIGVCEKGFWGTEPGAVTDIFSPTMMNARAINASGWQWFRTWVKLKPGVEPDRVREKLRAIATAYRAEVAKGWGPDMPPRMVEEYKKALLFLQPASAGASSLQREYRLSLAILAAVTMLVLLIACANVANLMTAQAVARAREMAVRVSIGAGRSRLVQLVMVEGAITALIASVIGGMFAWWSAPWVVSRIGNSEEPVRLILPPDWRVFGFAIALAMVVTLLFGAMPALRASTVRPIGALRGGEDFHTRRRLMNGLIAAQIAFCFLVHFVTGLFVSTFDRLANQPTGFVSEGLLAVETVTQNNVPSKRWDDVERHLRAVPGIQSAALCQWALMSGNETAGVISLDGKSFETYPPHVLRVSPGWFQTMRIPLLDGREFGPDDVFPGSAIVNEAFARHYFQGRNPVGRTFETLEKDKRVRTRIIGYVGNARYTNMRDAIRPAIYTPMDYRANGLDWATVMVRTTLAEPLHMAPLLQREVHRARPEFRVVGTRTQKEIVEQHTIRERLVAMLSLFFAIVAIVLSAVGLYGVLNYSVVQRRHEFGIRMALGAGAGSVARKVTSEVAAMLIAGAAAGLAAGLVSQRYIENLLYGVKATDPAMLMIPALTILTAAVFAALPPVIHALRIDPAVMLRAD